jgi:hypothetical protein
MLKYIADRWRWLWRKPKRPFYVFAWCLELLPASYGQVLFLAQDRFPTENRPWLGRFVALQYSIIDTDLYSRLTIASLALGITLLIWGVQAMPSRRRPPPNADDPADL